MESDEREGYKESLPYQLKPFDQEACEAAMARIHVIIFILMVAVSGTDAEALFPTDVISMLQMDTEVLRSLVASNTSDVGAEAAACQCLNWKNTYASGLVKCGDGLELTDSELELHPDVEFCHDFPGLHGTAFFPHADHKYCINGEKVKGLQQKRYPGQWCYVSSECQALRGGKAVNSLISYKMCAAEDDDTLGELPPAQLEALGRQLAEKTGWSDGQMLVLMAYDWAGPAEGEGTLVNLQGSLDPQKPAVGASLKADTFTVVYGKEVWEAHDGPGIHCVAGCPSE